MSSKSTDTNDATHPFKVGQWWIDDKGHEHPGSDIDGSLDTLFLRHLGQVKLIVSDRHMDIMWDASKVEERSLSSVLDRLSHCHGDISCKLNFFYFGWASEKYSSPKQAVERIVQVQQNRNVAILHPTLIDNHDLSEIKNGSKVIRSGYALW